MTISLVDQLTEEEAAVLAFYEENPGANWVEAAEALGVDEVHVCEISMKLMLDKELVEAGRKDHLVAFRVRDWKRAGDNDA
jgi:hypothetical protein